MGKTIPALLLDHLQKEATTYCLLTRILCKDGTKLGFTDLDVDLVYNAAGSPGDTLGSMTHTAENGGFSFARLENNADLSVGDTELSGVVADDGITEAEIRAGKFDFAEVWIYRVNYMDLSQGHELVAYGTAGQTVFSDSTWRVEFQTLTRQLSQPKVDLFSLSCGATFGSAACGKTFTWTNGTVTSVGSDTQREFTAGISPATNFYALGVVEWLTGDNAGAQMEVDSNTSGSFDLSLPMPYAIQVGDTFRVRKDCSKDWDDDANGCLYHWGSERASHFRGFPHIPVADGGASMIPGAQIDRD